MKNKILIVFLLLISILFVGCANDPIEDPNDDVTTPEISFLEANTELIEMKTGDKRMLPIDYDGTGDYTDLKVELDKPDLVTIDEGKITAVKAGIVNVTITTVKKSDLKTSFTIYINRNDIKQRQLMFDINTNGMKVGGVMDLSILNLDKLGAKGPEDFVFTSSDESIVRITEDYKLEALKRGEVTLTAQQKECPSNKGETTIYVGNQSMKKTPGGEPEDTKLVAYFEDGDFTIDASLDEQLIIEGAKNYQRYYYTTTDEDILLISDTGLFMAVSDGEAEITVISKDAKFKDSNTKLKVKVTGIRERDFKESFIKTALEQEGVAERTGNNDVRFTEWNHCQDAWCATFVSWCANNGGVPKDIVLRSISVRVFETRYRAMNRFFEKEVYKPVRGDLIIFSSYGASHIGIVLNSDDTRVYTIEGNTSNMVAKRQYYLDYKEITGYCHPDWERTGK